MKINSFKMITGEEIVAEVMEEGADFIKVKKPRQLGLAQVQVPGEEGPRLIPHYVPWLLTNANGEMDIIKGNILARVPSIPSEYEALYLQETTGLDLSSKLPDRR